MKQELIDLKNDLEKIRKKTNVPEIEAMILKINTLLIAISKKARPEHIRDIICEYFGISFSELITDCSKRKYVIPRQLIMYFQWAFTRESISDIGRSFNRDHTTAMYARDKIKEIIENKDENEPVKFHYENILNILNGIEISEEIRSAVKKEHNKEKKYYTPKPLELPIKHKVKKPFIRHKGEYSNHSPMHIATPGKDYQENNLITLTN